MKTLTNTLRWRRLSFAGAAIALLMVAALPTIALAAPKTSQNPQACNLSCLQTFGNTAIGKRQTSLQGETTKINTQVSKGRLTNDQATPLLNKISADESGLTTLQNTLDAITPDNQQNEQLARQDDKDIFTTYRIYAVFLPVTTHVALLDIMSNIDAKLEADKSKLQAAIQGDPQHQAQLDPLFNDYVSQLKEAEAQMDAAQGQLPVLTPSTYNEHNGDYQTAWNAFKSDCQNAYKALKQAISDHHQMVQILKGDLSKTTATATHDDSLADRDRSDGDQHPVQLVARMHANRGRHNTALRAIIGCAWDAALAVFPRSQRVQPRESNHGSPTTGVQPRGTTIVHHLRRATQSFPPLAFWQRPLMRRTIPNAACASTLSYRLEARHHRVSSQAFY